MVTLAYCGSSRFSDSVGAPAGSILGTGSCAYLEEPLAAAAIEVLVRLCITISDSGREAKHGKGPKRSAVVSLS
jgi:hypothetical protein